MNSEYPDQSDTRRPSSQHFAADPGVALTPAVVQSSRTRVERAGPLRRLGAVTYDIVLVVALIAFVTIIFVLFTGARVPASGWLRYFHQLALLLVSVGFFVFFWTSKGRTLGMQAWRLRVECMDGSLPAWRDALLRLAFGVIPWLPGIVMTMIAVQPAAPKIVATIGFSLFALVPLNYLIAWFDPQRRSWHDRFLRTRIVRQK